MSDEAGKDTDRLVQEASVGDAVAIDELLLRVLPELRAFVRLRAGPRILQKESEEDLVQSVCRECLLQLDGFEYRGVPQFKSWLFTRTLHKIYDRNKFYGRERRDAGREQAIPTDPQYLTALGSLLTASRVAMQAEDAARLEAAFEKLPDDYREVITLARIAGLSHAEIGEQMGRSPEATRVLLHRAMARLGTLLEAD
ncbi:MAG: sigma-70 family RNA polymerase sigma factor [Planctomycetes bacterium]|nr:sigma-70 family RNA polymerase sigma factor [Planctomycetota bacterium]